MSALLLALMLAVLFYRPTEAGQQEDPFAARRSAALKAPPRKRALVGRYWLVPPSQKRRDAKADRRAG